MRVLCVSECASAYPLVFYTTIPYPLLCLWYTGWCRWLLRAKLLEKKAVEPEKKKRRLRHLDRRAVAASSRLTSILLLLSASTVAVLMVVAVEGSGYARLTAAATARLL